MTQVNVGRVLEGMRAAGLSVELDERHRVRRAPFAMTALGRPARRLTLYPGTAERLDVVDMAPAVQQVVLLVVEPDRDHVRLFPSRVPPLATRNFLVGMDERSLFSAELPRPVRTVQEAHRALRPGDVVERESREEDAGVLTVRQGEWLFVPATVDEQRLMAQRRASLGYHHPIPGRLGKPHVAAVLAVVHPESRFDRVVFARGAVRHPDHSTLVLRGWHRVIGNMEVGRQSGDDSWLD